jgi:hypothetical protein
MTTVDAFLTNCRLADGRLVDIGIADGKIAVVGEGAPALSMPPSQVFGDPLSGGGRWIRTAPSRSGSRSRGTSGAGAPSRFGPSTVGAGGICLFAKPTEGAHGWSHADRIATADLLNSRIAAMVAGVEITFSGFR